MKNRTKFKAPFQTMQEAWEQSCADVLPDAGADQQEAMHNAFFYGAVNLFLLLSQSSGMRGNALFKELDKFMREEALDNITERKN